jgi:hypothetical protein
LTFVDDGSPKDAGHENNFEDVPIRLPEGCHGFRERFVGNGTVPLTRWLDWRACAHYAAASGATETS